MKSYETVRNKFENHFIAKRNVIFERAKFNVRIYLIPNGGHYGRELGREHQIEASGAPVVNCIVMSSNMADCDTVYRDLNENDIPGNSLEGRKPVELKNDELKFWLRCRGDPVKGLKTKAELAKRYGAFIFIHYIGHLQC